MDVTNSETVTRFVDLFKSAATASSSGAKVAKPKPAKPPEPKSLRPMLQPPPLPSAFGTLQGLAKHWADRASAADNAYDQIHARRRADQLAQHALLVQHNEAVETELAKPKSQQKKAEVTNDGDGVYTIKIAGVKPPPGIGGGTIRENEKINVGAPVRGTRRADFGTVFGSGTKAKMPSAFGGWLQPWTPSFSPTTGLPFAGPRIQANGLNLTKIIPSVLRPTNVFRPPKGLTP